MVEDALRVQLTVVPLPVGLHQREGGGGRFRVGMQHGHETTRAHDARAGEGLGGAYVQALQGRVMGRRPQDARVQHAGQLDVAREARRAGDLLPRIQPQRRAAHDLESGRRAQHGAPIDHLGDPRPAGEVGVGHEARRLAGHRHPAVRGLQP